MDAAERIGSNVSGLVGYIREAWDEHAPSLSLWPQTGDERPEAVVQRDAWRLRIPTHEQFVYNRLRAMFPPDLKSEWASALDTLWRDPPALRRRLEELGYAGDAKRVESYLVESLTEQAEYASFHSLASRQGKTPNAALDKDFRELLWKWFERKIVVVEDYQISGDGLVSLIADDTPPNYLSRIVGLQNIKGTGLDFVYRWQAWDSCYKACALLTSQDPAEAERGLRMLASFLEYGHLCNEHVRTAVDKVKSTPVAQNESFQAELAMILSNLDQAIGSIEEPTGQRSSSGWWTSVLNGLEGFLDPGDSVKRRRTADRVYRDLVAERISCERAVSELKALNARQKGGWLLKSFEAVQRRVTASLATYARGIKRR